MTPVAARDADEPAAARSAPADVTAELGDRTETTVRDVEPEPAGSESDQEPVSSERAEYRAAEYRAAGYGPRGNGPGGNGPARYAPAGYPPAEYAAADDGPADNAPADDQAEEYAAADDQAADHQAADDLGDVSGDRYGTGGVEVVPVRGGWEAVRRRHRRQTVTFLAAFVLVLGVGFVAWLTYSGDVPWPFGGKVTTSQAICTRSKPLPPQQITVRVYNGSTRRGLAASVAAQLKAYGFTVQDTGNDPLEAKLRTAIELRHGDSGKAAALTVRAYLAGKVRDVRDDRQADTVDVVLGPSFTHVNTRREASRALAALTPQLPLACPAGATPTPSTSRSR
jgi:hypothetical protein